MTPYDESEWAQLRQGYIDADPIEGRKIIDAVEKWLTDTEALLDEHLAPGQEPGDNLFALRKQLTEAFPYLDTKDFNVAMMCEVLDVAAKSWKWREEFSATWSGFEKMLFLALTLEKMAAMAEFAAGMGDDDE